MVTQVGQLVIAQVDPVKEDLAGRGVIETGQQTHEGRLTRACRTHDAHASPRFNFEGNVVQDRVIFVVAERDIPEGHGSQGTRDSPRVVPLGHIWHLIEEGESALRAGQRALQVWHHQTEGLERSVKLRKVGHHQEQFTQCKGACYDVAHTDEEDGCGPDRGDQTDEQS